MAIDKPIDPEAMMQQGAARLDSVNIHTLGQHLKLSGHQGEWLARSGQRGKITVTILNANAVNPAIPRGNVLHGTFGIAHKPATTGNAADKPKSAKNILTVAYAPGGGKNGVQEAVTKLPEAARWQILGAARAAVEQAMANGQIKVPPSPAEISAAVIAAESQQAAAA